MSPSSTGWRSRRQLLLLRRLGTTLKTMLRNVDEIINKVNGVLLDRLVLEEEYVAVLFLGECLEEEKVCSED